MVKHVLLWKLRDDLSAEEKRDVQEAVKKGLERLPGIIPGLVEAKVAIDPLGTSNADIYLDSTCTDQAALAVYQDHPEHVKIKEIIGPAAEIRLCMDYEVSDWNAENLFRG